MPNSQQRHRKNQALDPDETFGPLMLPFIDFGSHDTSHTRTADSVISVEDACHMLMQLTSIDSLSFSDRLDLLIKLLADMTSQSQSPQNQKSDKPSQNFGFFQAWLPSECGRSEVPTLNPQNEECEEQSSENFCGFKSGFLNT